MYFILQLIFLKFGSLNLSVSYLSVNYLFRLYVRQSCDVIL